MKYICELSTPMIISQKGNVCVLQGILWYPLYFKKSTLGRPQLHLDQRPTWPMTCLSLYKIFVGSVPNCYSCPGALYFYISVKASATLPGMAIRQFRLWVSVSPLRHLPLGQLWVTRPMDSYSPQLFHPSTASKLNEYHLFPVILYCLFWNHFF